jgi:hypothetical protein
MWVEFYMQEGRSWNKSIIHIFWNIYFHILVRTHHVKCTAIPLHFRIVPSKSSHLPFRGETLSIPCRHKSVSPVISHIVKNIHLVLSLILSFQNSVSAVETDNTSPIILPFRALRGSVFWVFGNARGRLKNENMLLGPFRG